VNGFHPATYSIRDHQTSRFTLKGAHAAVACVDCHLKGRRADDWQFHFGNLACAGCHQDPHQGEFPAAMTAASEAGPDVCESCHGLASWQKLKPFDHAQTEFPLTGAHLALGCLDCHRPPTTPIPLTPLTPLTPEGRSRRIPFKASRQCAGCHEDIHGGQFRTAAGDIADCARCHTTSRWLATGFDHETGSTFSLRGAHKDVPCRMCHKMQQSTAGRTIAVYKGTPRECASCHK
jgi:predicted CXXCH cytochrome family protein